MYSKPAIGATVPAKPVETDVLLFSGPELPWELKRLPLVAPSECEILVKVLACTLCGSDLHSIGGRRTVPVPSVLGHEIVGEIIAFGSEAPQWDLQGSPLAVGDRICWAIVASCDECFYCRKGLPQKCEQAFKYGHEQFDVAQGASGGLSEHCMLVPGTKIMRLPRSMSLAAACPISCATSTIAAAFRHLNVQRNERVLITGAGMLGLTACAMAHAIGAQSIVCVERSSERRALATQFGALTAVAPEELANTVTIGTYGYGFDCAIECTGNNEVTAVAFDALRMGGRLGLVGAVFPSQPVPIRWERLVRRQIAVSGIHNYASQDLEQAVRFMTEAEGTYPFAKLVEHTFALDQIDAALSAAKNPANIRVAIMPRSSRNAS